MSSGFLNFGLPRPDALNFGRAVSYDHELTLIVTLAPPSGLVRFYGAVRLEVSSGLRWQTSHPYRTDRTAPQPSALPETVAVSIADRAGQPLLHPIRADWTAGQWILKPLQTPWTSGAILPCTATLAWTSGQISNRAIQSPWGQGQFTLCTAALRFEAAQPINGMIACPMATAQPLMAPVEGLSWSSGALWAHDESLRHKVAKSPPLGWRIVPYVRPPSVKHEGRLNFVCPKPHYLNFGLQCLGSALLYPALRRSYRVLNTASLIRVSDSTDLPCSSIKVSLDWASWCWSLSATLIGPAAHDLVPAYPGKVRATLNGFVWDFVVDDLRYNRSFGAFSATLSGRSPAAVMAEPYSATRSYTEANLATAQQLALQELISGWQLDWAVTLTDWTVPANTYQYQNLTPLASILRIIKATGGRVYADAVDSVLHALPKWPIAPWDWASAVPDQSLSSSYTLTEQRNAAPGAEYDCIVVSGGVNNGICALATRDGMPGTYPANAVVDALITDLAPATARAVQEIADAWPMKHYSLSLPLQATPAGAGLLMPGTIFDFVDGADGWRGLVTGVTLTAGRNSIVQDLEVIAP
ncbi:MAG TPA: hypothetical protein PK959_15835 [Candidatus Competibacteraceae bacterium]|nr:hypothetical protein [Candidatus Competibacteraceae bacterium]